MTSAKTQFFELTRAYQLPAEPLPILSGFSEAYAIQTALFDRQDKIAGWKLGGVNHATRTAFNVSGTYAGPVSAQNIIAAQPIMSSADFGFNCQGELELAVLLGDVEAFWRGDCDIASVITKIAPAIECPASVLNFPDDGIFALIADGCAAGTIIHGNWHKWDEFDQANQDMPIQLFADDMLVAEGVYSNLIEGVVKIVASFLHLAKLYKLDVRAGDIVATGGITPCVSLQNNTSLKVCFPQFDAVAIRVDSSKVKTKPTHLQGVHND